jgi:prevent-host-death family protein
MEPRRTPPAGRRRQRNLRYSDVVGRFPKSFAAGARSPHRTDSDPGVTKCGQPHVAECSTLRYDESIVRTIAQRQLRNENAQVMDAVVAGETFVVTRNGEPVAELRPLRAHRRTFIAREDIVALAATGMRIDHRQFRSDLDAVIDQSL